MNVDEEFVRRRIQQKLDGRGCLYGYRAMWHAGSRSRCGGLFEKSSKLCVSAQPNSNYSWHIDGYAKLKPYRFPVHGPLATRSQSCKESLKWHMLENECCKQAESSKLQNETLKNCVQMIKLIFR